MSIQEQAYKSAWQKLQDARYVLIVTHINPDADTIGGALGLANCLFDNGIRHKVFNTSKKLPRNLDFLSRFEKITHQLPKSYDVLVSIDCGDKSRFGFELDEEASLINIDHHSSNTFFGELNLVDSTRASSAEIVYEFLKASGQIVGANIATALYTGIYDDSLAFTALRTDKRCFQAAHELVQNGANPAVIANLLKRRDSLAKYRLLPLVLESLELFEQGKVACIVLKPQWLKQTGATSDDAQQALDMVLSIAVVEVAFFIRLSSNKTRVSLRAKNDFDVSKVAQAFGGGGHKMASGCSLDGTTDITKAKKILLEKIHEQYDL